MALTLLPRSGTSLTIGGDDVTAQLTSFVIRSDTEMTRSETFATEGKRDQEPGSEGIQVDLGGWLAYDAAEAFTPIPAVQAQTYYFEFFTDCSLSIIADMPSATMGATVGALRFFTMSLLSKANAWSVAWDKTPPP